jgi:hypothetical protein
MPEKTPITVVLGRGSPLSAISGLWMVLGSIAGATWLLWEGNGWVVVLLVYIGVLGLLLLLEARPRKDAGRPAVEETSAGMIITVPEQPPETVRPAWRMPIWLHILLQLVVTVPGFFGGAILRFCTGSLIIMGLAALFRPPEGQAAPGGAVSVLGTCCIFLIAAPLFFGGAALGGGQARRLLLEYVPARCSACGGSAYCKIGSPVKYHCQSCGHIHETKVHAR